MADFEAVIRKAVDGLANNTPENRAKVYDKARSAVVRQLEDMKPRPPQELLARQVAKLDAAIAAVENTQPGSYLDWDWLDSESQSTLHDNAGSTQPRVPRQLPGLIFTTDSDRGLITATSSSKATDDERQQISGLRSALLEAVDDLIDLTRGSNAYIQIERIAKRYRGALQNELDEVEVDRLYAYGTRLENAAFQLRKRIQTDDFPDLDVNIAEALDSVIAIHGPTILSTAAGRDLQAKSREYSSSDDVANDKYREVALTLWRDARGQFNFIDRDDLEDVIGINSDINESSNQSRTVFLAHATNNNLIVTVAKVAMTVSGVVLLKGFENSIPGLAMSSHVTNLIDGCIRFLSSNRETLLLLAQAGGSELSWIEPFIRWIQRKIAQRS